MTSGLGALPADPSPTALDGLPGAARTIHRHATTFARKRAKTDRQDPWRITEVVSQPAWLPHPLQVAARTLDWQRLTRHRPHVVRRLTRHTNDAARDLFLTANGLARQPLWSDPRG